MRIERFEAKDAKKRAEKIEVYWNKLSTPLSQALEKEANGKVPGWTIVSFTLETKLPLPTESELSRFILDDWGWYAESIVYDLGGSKAESSEQKTLNITLRRRVAEAGCDEEEIE